jgi:hypothetical protein
MKKGKKFDHGKPSTTLIPTKAILGMADVLNMGAEKYGRLNWTSGIVYSRIVDAAQRHILAFQGGEDLDPESGKSHLFHAMVNLSFLVYFQEHNPELDDRWEKKPSPKRKKK